MKFLSGNLKEGEHSEDQGVDGIIISEWISGNYGGNICTEFIWLRIGTSGGLL
jgi:hypothetical protein